MKVVQNYNIIFEGIRAPVLIIEDSITLLLKYQIATFNVSKYTQIFLDKMKEDIEREGIFNLEDKDKDYDNLRKFYMKKIDELLHYYFPNIDLETKDKLTTYFVQKNIDLGYIDLLISDNMLEEIVVNGAQEKIRVYHRKYGWLETNLELKNENELQSLISRIAFDNKKNFSNLNPLLDASLKGGHRVNATIENISTHGSTVTIRRFREDPWTITDLVENDTITPLILSYIWIAIENELSIIVSGGTSSGKTSFLNAIMQLIPIDQRIISVEDTREIELAKNTHWVPLKSREANQEGKGEVTTLDLIVNSLRMRPDRIIIGEIRRKKEAEVLFEAMRTGHSVYGTFHANNSNETILRLSSPPIEIPKITLSAIGMIVVQHRDRKSGLRYTSQIAEIEDDGTERIIYQYNLKERKYIQINKPKYIIKRLYELQGITEDDFEKEIRKRILVINFLLKKKIKDINKIERVISYYYKKEDKLMDLIKKSNSQTKKIES